ncbi:MAG: hypothetical protein R2751_02700 [Bacteroidales bacterium]
MLPEKDHREFHIYVKAKVGAVSYVPASEIVLIEERTYFVYGAYLGVEFSPFQKVGALGYGKKSFSQFGIVYIF